MRRTNAPIVRAQVSLVQDRGYAFLFRVLRHRARDFLEMSAVSKERKVHFKPRTAREFR